jgi:hypothetical protein
MSSISLKIVKLFGELSEDYIAILLENDFIYIFSKSIYFLEDGESVYRQKDFFKLPDQTYSPEDILAVKRGCNQIIKGYGFSEENSFEDLGIRGLYKLFELFHYKMCNQKIVKKNNEYTIDKIEFHHKMKKTSLTCFNKVI